MYLATIYDNRIRSDRQSSLVAAKSFSNLTEAHEYLKGLPWHFLVFFEELRQLENQPFSVVRSIYVGCIGTATVFE